MMQGWRFSQTLCNIYYGTMDSEYFSNYMEKPGEFFIRNVDDYLFVTTEPERVSQLARIMKKGMGTYNCYFNKEKSQNNLPKTTSVESNQSHSEAAAAVPDSSSYKVTFNGWRFCLKTGHVMRDFSSYIGVDISSTLSFFMRKSKWTNNET